MRPMFPYYGSKWNIARDYPPPTGDIVVDGMRDGAVYAGRNGAVMATIALIEPDASLASAMTIALQLDGHKVILHADGTSALAAFRSATPDLVLAALRAPGVNGHEILRHARRISPVPVILMSPRRDEVDEMIALKLGADDFLSGPPSPAVVVARVGVILKRAGSLTRHATQANPDEPLRYGDLSFDTSKRSCALNDHPIELTTLEAVLLGALFFKAGAVLSRTRLTDLLYGLHADMDPRIVDSYIKRLRIKFRTASPHFDPIETIYRAGYRLRSPVTVNGLPKSPEIVDHT